MTASRREPAVALGLAAAGCGLLFVASAVPPEPAGAGALALVAGAGAAAALAARGWLRRAVGVVLLVMGLVAVVRSAGGPAWWGVAGGVVTAAAGCWVAVRGPRWARWSGRYERPGGGTDGGDVPARALWDALDRGEDPTAGRRDLPE